MENITYILGKEYLEIFLISIFELNNGIDVSKFEGNILWKLLYIYINIYIDIYISIYI